MGGARRIPGLDEVPELDDPACEKENPELWFSEDPGEMRAAKEICNKVCPAKFGCMAFSLKTRQVHGIWGGMDEKRRRQLLGIDVLGKTVRSVQSARCPNCRGTRVKKSRGRYGRAWCEDCAMSW